MAREACPKCKSRDNVARYEDGSAYCFGAGCGYNEQPTSPQGNTPGEALRPNTFGAVRPAVVPALDWSKYSQLPEGPIESRFLSESVTRKYRYRRHPVDNTHVCVYFNAKSQPCAIKKRHEGKRFSWEGDAKGARLFGANLFRSPGKQLIITEGEIDAMSVHQALDLRWPVVSVKNGATGAMRQIQEELEWVEGFERVILMFDQDKAGREATDQVAGLLSPGKVYVASLPRKDANECLKYGESRAIVEAVWQASQYRPDGIVDGMSLIDDVLKPPPPSVPYPWAGVNDYLRGQRIHEVTTWCGGTGAGKSQLQRELIYYLRERGEKVGVIALEENVRRAALSQVSLIMNRKLHEPSVRAEIPDEEIRGAAAKALDGLYFYNHWGSVDPDILIPKIRYMVKGLGVRWVILDHISIMVSGMATDGDERKRLDVLMTRIGTLTQEAEFGMHLVCHLRKAGGVPHEEGGRITLDDLRGSGALKQISHNVVALERDQQSDDETTRNTTRLRVLKCREFGDTGVCAALRYSKEDGRLRETVLDATPNDTPSEGDPF